jgi:uncharacterized protein with PhoU and TrkA domain
LKAEEEHALSVISRIMQYTSIAVDLALYSVAFYDKEAALEVLRLENRIDEDCHKLFSKLLLAVRAPRESPLALGIMRLATALDTASDAAGDLAGIVLKEVPVHKLVRADVNCCGEVVTLIKLRRPIATQPSLVDILLAKRGSMYILGPSWDDLKVGDVLVVRGPLEEVEDLAREAGYDLRHQLKTFAPIVAAAIAGDELSSSLLHLKSAARLTLDLAFQALTSNDVELADEVLKLEDEIDDLYLTVLEKTYSATNPILSKEYASIAIFAKSMESLGDAAAIIARLIIEGEDSEFLAMVSGKSEEGFVKLEVSKELRGKHLASIPLQDLGLIPLAIRRSGLLILPIPLDLELREGDIIIAKYYRPSDVSLERKLLISIEGLGFRILSSTLNVRAEAF